MEWLGWLPLSSPPDITVLHVVDVASVRAPLVGQSFVSGNDVLSRRKSTALGSLRIELSAKPGSLCCE